MVTTKSKIDKWYCILLAVIGLMMSFAIPVMQTPDESAHLQMIATSLNNEKIADNILKDIESEEYKIFIDQSKDIHSYKINVDQYIKLMAKEPEYSMSSMLPHGIKLSVIKHFPSAIGITIGCIMHLPSLAVLQLAEAFSVLFYVLVIYASLKVLPIKKCFFRCFAISPMVIQQISSINYDTVLLPLCFLYVAYILHIKFDKKEVNVKDVVFLLSLLVVIAYIKIPYFFLGFLIFIIPLHKCQIELCGITINETFVKKYKIVIVPLVCMILVFGFYLIRNQYYVRLAIGMVQEWRRTIYLFKSTIETWGIFVFISSVGNFGWLDTPISIFCALLIYIIFFVTSLFYEKKENAYTTIKWEWKDYCIVFITFFFLCILITMSMVNHTITVMLYGVEKICDYNIREALYQIPYIGGLQGRYYIPFLMLPFMLLPQKISCGSKIEKKLLTVVEILCFMSVVAYISYVLLNRYWVV